jgi:hypothetical protein
MKSDKQTLENIYALINEAQAPEPGYAKARERGADDMAHYGNNSPELNASAHGRSRTGVNAKLYNLLINPDGVSGEATITVTGKKVEVKITADRQILFRNAAALTPEEQREVMRYIQTSKVIRAAFPSQGDM